MKRKILLAFLLLFGGICAFSAVKIGTILYRYRQADEIYDDLRTQYVVRVPQDTEPAGTAADTAAAETDAVPAPAEKAPITVDFDALLRENGDVVGWIYCEDTPISYPVVQSKDNGDYLRSDLHGNYLVSGTLFVDYRCPAVGTAKNHIIYGHNMNNDTMFGTLVNYGEQSYYEAHPVMYYLTPGQAYKLELFAGFITRPDSEVYYPEPGGTDGFEAFLGRLRAQSTFVSDVTVTGDDRIVTLSTCSDESGARRYVVFGKLIAIDA